ncbi:hypothetical protein DP939_02665 [Spongiactinospora rosea]|uniref:SHOCT domain-containing protein n=2 Tax=Spongiactinospora rosea TaxID=2248750 RepID=A0A366M8Y6_9ACTN|nr:hypothetical protein DP939_02665 [Spongiactinospora rosea]
MITLESVHDPRGVQQAINHASHQARLREQHAARQAMVPVVSAPTGVTGGGEAFVSQLERLGALVRSGDLTRAEFEAAKAELLRRST